MSHVGTKFCPPPPLKLALPALLIRKGRSFWDISSLGHSWLRMKVEVPSFSGWFNLHSPYDPQSLFRNAVTPNGPPLVELMSLFRTARGDTTIQTLRRWSESLGTPCPIRLGRFPRPLRMARLIFLWRPPNFHPSLRRLPRSICRANLLEPPWTYLIH
ncbi:hypothetical protein E2320_004397 [Naja naja]|nr:hypothetical protein E2320_004397 [Naja naja]